MTDRSSQQELIELLYDDDLPAHIAAWRRAGDSWRTIAAKVSARTGRPISDVTLLRWYGKAAS